ncbi:adenine nucleotide translocase lysine N-methyltransferase-like [Candoia aspera]|uniref:adenine nucleotide translocase lysine N-methyltransferase-like n=1 Tax=Candoia aspera TaxID=51853 RepID=UPI002FD7B7D3
MAARLGSARLGSASRRCPRTARAVARNHRVASEKEEGRALLRLEGTLRPIELRVILKLKGAGRKAQKLLGAMGIARTPPPKPGSSPAERAFPRIRGGRLQPEPASRARTAARASSLGLQPGPRGMDWDDVLEAQAAELQQKGGSWRPFQIASSTGFLIYFAWTGALALRFRKVSPQVPYVPSSAKQVQNMMSLLKGRSGKLVDLGSGDGRIVLEAYKQGFQPVIGYELNPWLLKLSHFHAWRAGCYGKVFYLQQDLWKADLSDCSNVTVFLAPSVVPQLENKLLSELPEEACVVAARFPFLKWTPSKVVGESLEKAWAYNIREVRQGKEDTSGSSSAEAAVLAPNVRSCSKDGREEV